MSVDVVWLLYCCVNLKRVYIYIHVVMSFSIQEFYHTVISMYVTPLMSFNGFYIYTHIFTCLHIIHIAILHGMQSESTFFMSRKHSTYISEIYN